MLLFVSLGINRYIQKSGALKRKMYANVQENGRD